MSHVFHNIISAIADSPKISACLKLCGILNISDVILIDDSLLDDIERFISQKCMKMSIEERENYLESEILHNPQFFMFSPANRQRILNLCKLIKNQFKNGPTELIDFDSNFYNIFSQFSSILSKSQIENLKSIKIDGKSSINVDHVRNKRNLSILESMEREFLPISMDLSKNLGKIDAEENRNEENKENFKIEENNNKIIKKKAIIKKIITKKMRKNERKRKLIERVSEMRKRRKYQKNNKSETKLILNVEENAENTLSVKKINEIIEISPFDKKSIDISNNSINEIDNNNDKTKNIDKIIDNLLNEVLINNDLSAKKDENFIKKKIKGEKPKKKKKIGKMERKKILRERLLQTKKKFFARKNNLLEEESIIKHTLVKENSENALSTNKIDKNTEISQIDNKSINIEINEIDNTKSINIDNKIVDNSIKSINLINKVLYDNDLSENNDDDNFIEENIKLEKPKKNKKVGKVGRKRMIKEQISEMKKTFKYRKNDDLFEEESILKSSLVKENIENAFPMNKTDKNTEISPFNNKSINIDNKIVDNSIKSDILLNNSSFAVVLKDLNSYYGKMAQICENYFINYTYVPREDYDFLFPEEGRTAEKPYGYLDCHLCKTLQRRNSRTKFNLSHRGNLVLCNIVHHLKCHFRLKKTAA